MNTLTFDPVLPLPILLLLGVILLAIGIWSYLRFPRGMWFRAAACLLVWISLFNPQIIQKETQDLNDIALVLVDRSSSQTLQDRTDQTDQTLAALKAKLADTPNLEVRYLDITPDGKEDKRGTRALGTLQQAISGIDPDRYAGAILITDGQVHDLGQKIDTNGPLHVLLTGHKDDQDRRLKIVDAPHYGLVNHPLTIRAHVLDNGKINPAAPLRLILPDGSKTPFRAVENGAFEAQYTPKHAGDTVLVIETDPLPGEISLSNNVYALNVNGVHDRLRVLLVSGQPHQGQRTWRNILRSDPAVDLVHFTILRPSEKEDFTPLNELSLIAFPVRELFEEKLDDFDLIIFDRYYKHNVLSESYFDNIKEYVKNGGALLVSAGPDFAGPRSLAHTRLGDLLPARPSGQVLEDTPYRITRSQTGARHPISANLSGDENKWGRWVRVIDTTDITGKTILQSDKGNPLLVVNRIDDGRIAMLLSDQMWMWARGFDGGGPHADLVRHVVHWLMKEPDLEEERLILQKGDQASLDIIRQSLSPDRPVVTVTRPDGSTEEITLRPIAKGRSQATIEAATPGIYRAQTGEYSAVTTVGSPNPKEFIDPRASALPLQEIIAQTGGDIRWIDDGLPRIRRTGAEASSFGSGWIGLKQNNAKAVIGSQHTALLPVWLIFLLALGLWLAGWWRESR
ncbi:hypothetical protein [Terasakiella pusilla]|uniref:DUF7408 domain-containing protein n=1 Tax=Terasakiella pusilla TaxID=64973 RepID=UPI003AA97668